MKVKIYIDDEIKEIELPLECDYGAIVDDDVIRALYLPPQDDKIIPAEYINRIVINKTHYTSVLREIEKDKGLADEHYIV